MVFGFECEICPLMEKSDMYAANDGILVGIMLLVICMENFILV